MARPAKQRLEYFPFDVDFFQDIKIRKLIKRQGGKAITVYASLLCIIYKNGYYMQWDEELSFIASELSGFDEAYISEVIKTCLSLGLFNRDLFNNDKVLSSKGIQTRYCSIQRLNKRIARMDKFCLIEPPEQTAVSNAEKKNHVTNKRPAKRQSKPSKPSEPPKPKQPQQSAPFITPSVEKYSVPFKDEVARMKNDAIWLEQGVCMKYSITPCEAHARLDEFLAHCISYCNERPHTSYGDAQRHFIRWYKGDVAAPKQTNSNEPQSASDYTYSGGFGGEDV